MQFSTLALAAFATAASAQKTWVVNVGQNGSLTFSPNKVTAAKGDAVQFQFVAGDHSVVMSTFDGPCVPVNNNNASIIGFNSGFMQANADPSNIPTYTVMINSTAPIWAYCGQGKHCQAGMSMVINENTAANSSRSLENYQSASKGTTTVNPSGSFGGTAGTGTSSGSSSSSSSGSSSGSGTSTGTGSSGTSTTSSTSTTSTAASSSIKAPSTLGLFAALMAMFAL